MDGIHPFRGFMRIPMLVLAGLFTASSLHAQGKPQTREGFTISFGFGGGSAGFSCDACTSDRESGGAGYLRIGGAIRPNLILAGQSSGWVHEENNANLVIATTTFSAQFYPVTASGFYLLGGLGVGTVGTSTTFGSTTTTTSGTGLGIELGTGYDWRVGKNFSLTPFISYFATGGVKIDEEKTDGNAITFGLGFTWH
jgi:hypothetical protein